MRTSLRKKLPSRMAAVIRMTSWFTIRPGTDILVPDLAIAHHAPGKTYVLARTSRSGSMDSREEACH